MCILAYADLDANKAVQGPQASVYRLHLVVEVTVETAEVEEGVDMCRCCR